MQHLILSVDVGSLEQDIRPTVRVTRGDGGHCGRQFETTIRIMGFSQTPHALLGVACCVSEHNVVAHITNTCV